MSRERVFLDANVIVSGLAYNGKQARILELADAGRIRLVLAEQVLVEARDVLENKFQLPRGVIDGLLSGIDYELAPLPSPEAVCEAAKLVRDPDDAVILASIVVVRPDVALTGDKDLLTDEVKAVAPMCTCADYLRRLQPD
jgi:putative PIN family toxin of toxin-antitoxin system